VKHVKESMPYLVTGQLLGLDIGRSLEVTNCFPFPSRGEREEQEDPDSESVVEYQWEMMKCLREVNVDNNTVGWYQSAYLGSFLNEALIETQFSYQTTIPKCVALIYDPIRTKQGSLSMKAYRLTEVFMELFKNQTFTQEALLKTGLSFNDIVEEIPIVMHNSHYVNAFLHELEDSKPLSGLDFERLDLASNPFLERNLDYLIEYIDDLAAEQSKFQYWQRTVQRQEVQKALYLKKKKADGARPGEPEEEDLTQMFKPITHPSRLESLLITNQINNYCHQINQFAGQGLGKLYVVAGLQVSEKKE